MNVMDADLSGSLSNDDVLFCELCMTVLNVTKLVLLYLQFIVYISTDVKFFNSSLSTVQQTTLFYNW